MRLPNKTKLSSKAGVTLVETILGITIVASLLWSLYMLSARNASWSRYRSEASLMSLVLESGVEDILSGNQIDDDFFQSAKSKEFSLSQFPDFTFSIRSKCIDLALSDLCDDEMILINLQVKYDNLSANTDFLLSK